MEGELRGMFDTFCGVFKCPICGYEAVEDFQTKELGENLHHWKVGDKVIMNGLEIAKGIVDVYTTSNHKCLDNDWVYYWVDAKAYIENGIFVGLNDFNLSDEETMHVAEENDERIVLKNEKGRRIHFIYKNKKVN